MKFGCKMKTDFRPLVIFVSVLVGVSNLNFLFCTSEAIETVLRSTDNATDVIIGTNRYQRASTRHRVSSFHCFLATTERMKLGSRSMR
jgi:hypothetical protein